MDGDTLFQWIQSGKLPDSIKNNDRATSGSGIVCRISRTLKKSHGAFRPFMAQFRDCFMMLYKTDVDAVIEYLRVKKQLSEAEIAYQRKYYNWKFFVKNCRRKIPEAHELLKRFDKLVEVYSKVKDARTEEPLFRPDTLKELKKLRSHIEKGCLSDPPGVPLYVFKGWNTLGLKVYRCLRGTNSLEGYHRHYRRVRRVFHSCLSPAFAHLKLRWYNYRWNMDRGISNVGWDMMIGNGCYNHYYIDEIQIITQGWYSGLWPSSQ